MELPLSLSQDASTIQSSGSYLARIVKTVYQVHILVVNAMLIIINRSIKLKYKIAVTVFMSDCFDVTSQILLKF
jgi:hypothetical protein